MDKRQRFGKVLIQAEHTRHGASHLSNLDGVGQTVTKMVRQRRREDLSLMFQPAEGSRMNDPVAVALKYIPVRVLGFRIPAAMPGITIYRAIPAWP
jgi:hypothetical protein